MRHGLEMIAQILGLERKLIISGGEYSFISKILSNQCKSC